MELNLIQREVLLLAAESGGRPRLPAPAYLAVPVDQLMQEGMLVLGKYQRVVISNVGRQALAEVGEGVLQEDRRSLGLGP
jgi:hypothetical protein